MLNKYNLIDSLNYLLFSIFTRKLPLTVHFLHFLVGLYYVLASVGDAYEARDGVGALIVFYYISFLIYIPKVKRKFLLFSN